MSEKKDVLDFPLEEVEVPQAIVLMMQAATQCVGYIEDGQNAYPVHLVTADDRLQQLCEKLEARVEDAIEAAVDPPSLPDDDEPEKFLDADRDSITEVWADDDVFQIVRNGVIFGKFCNTQVYDDGVNRTACIKQWGHNNHIHEDQYGNEYPT